MTAAAQTEQKPQPTPGPWVYERGTHVHGGHHVITARHAGMTSASPLAVLSNILDEVDGSAEADARLIAAAPDLRLALEEMLILHYGSSADLDEQRARWNSLSTYEIAAAVESEARDAIAKADGAQAGANTTPTEAAGD